MAAFTSVAAGVGLAATATTTGMSFAQTAKQRKLQLQAQEASKEFMAKARKRFDVNYYDALSVPREPYELQRDAMLASGAQAIEAAKESNRGVAATAGRVAMAQNEGQGQIRSAMNQDLMNLERLSAQEDSRLRDVQGQLDLEEVAGAQLQQANAWSLEQRALQQGMAGVGAMAGQIAALPPLYGGVGANLQQPQSRGVAANLQQPQIRGVAEGKTTGANAGLTDVPPIPGDLNNFGGVISPNMYQENPDLGANLDFQAPPPPQYNGQNIRPEFAGMSMSEIIAQLEMQGIMLSGNNPVEAYQFIYQ